MIRANSQDDSHRMIRATGRAPSRSPLWLAYDSLRLASRLAVVYTAAA